VLKLAFSASVFFVEQHRSKLDDLVLRSVEPGSFEVYEQQVMFEIEVHRSEIKNEKEGKYKKGLLGNLSEVSWVYLSILPILSLFPDLTHPLLFFGTPLRAGAFFP
jgi:hypothetical protein